MEKLNPMRPWKSNFSTIFQSIHQGPKALEALPRDTFEASIPSFNGPPNEDTIF